MPAPAPVVRLRLRAEPDAPRRTWVRFVLELTRIQGEITHRPSTTVEGGYAAALRHLDRHPREIAQNPVSAAPPAAASCSRDSSARASRGPPEVSGTRGVGKRLPPLASQMLLADPPGS